MSASRMAVLRPRFAAATAKSSVTIDLPTPPFPLMTAMTFLNQWLLFEQQVVGGGWNTAFLVGQVIGSVLNVAIFVVFAWGYLRGSRGNVLKQS